MRRALITGINDYKWAPLSGCINDANAVYELLDKHEDGSPNFDCKKLTSDKTEVTRTFLKKQIHQLFSNQADIALLYFSGHGASTPFGGYLVTQDAYKYDEGVSMNDVLVMANQAKVNEIIILLDCCYSGNLGNNPMNGDNVALLREGVTIISSSADYQVSKERKGLGVFTRMITEALDGEAADILGKVNIGGLYDYSDKAFDAWEQRPIFKSHITSMVPIRNCHPKMDLNILRKLPEYFKNEQDEHSLDPSYESESNQPDTEKNKIFSHLQKCNSLGLVTPVGEVHMYFAAMNSKSCKLTKRGQYYWKLAKDNKI